MSNVCVGSTAELKALITCTATEYFIQIFTSLLYKGLTDILYQKTQNLPERRLIISNSSLKSLLYSILNQNVLVLMPLYLSSWFQANIHQPRMF